jgi:hypothetical protein
LLNRNLDVRKSGRDGKDDEGDFNMTFGSQWELKVAPFDNKLFNGWSRYSSLICFNKTP